MLYGTSANRFRMHPDSGKLILLAALVASLATACGGGGGGGTPIVSPPPQTTPPPPPPAPPPASVNLVVDDAAAVVEGQTLVYAGRVTAGSLPRTISIAITRAMAVSNATPDQKAMRANLFAPGEYIANGTVFTRSVASMPLAGNSAAIAAYAPTMPAQYLPDPFKSWLVTSINTEHYNIPIYVVDSTDPAQPHATFSSTDPRVTTRPDLVRLTTGRIPLPGYGVPDSIGDKALAIYDKGTGLMREYFYLQKQADGSWTFSASGYYQSNRWFGDLPGKNYFMQLTQGTSSVVGMLNPISQIGIAEARAGQINHALSLTFPNAARGVTSFPAKGNDGTDANPNAPAQGQWFRIDPGVNIDALNLRPFTKVVAKAIQRYGGFGADKNLWCFAFNVEHPVNETAAGKPNPWGPQGDITRKYGSLDLNDFPWHLTQWAPVNWNGQGPDAAFANRQNVVVEINGVQTVLGLDGGDVQLPAGVGTFTIRVPTSTLNGFDQLDVVTAKVSMANGAATISDSGAGKVTDSGGG